MNYPAKSMNPPEVGGAKLVRGRDCGIRDTPLCPGTNQQSTLDARQVSSKEDGDSAPFVVECPGR